MTRKSTILITLSFFLLLFLTPATVAGQQIDTSRASIRSSNTIVEWRTRIPYESAKLVVSGPNDFILEKEFPAGVFPYFETLDEFGVELESGSYTYEIQLTPYLAPEIKAELTASNHAVRDELVASFVAEGLIPSESQLYISGSLSIVDGKFISSALEESSDVAQQSDPGNGLITPNDQVTFDDMIVQGSICAGLDCANGESFGFDTLRLKENNLRIRAFDTSNSASFPTTDWQITFNDSSNGGLNKFSIDDITSGRTPFTIEANAPSHSLYVEDGGRVGFGTSTPLTDIHIKSGNTPTVRLEQDGTSGFSTQTWDVAGNEAGFFIRDTTNGSKLSFRIFPSAPQNSLVIEGSGDIGLGTTSPSAPMHILRADGTAQMYVDENNGTVANRTLVELENNGTSHINYTNSDSSTQWKVGTFDTAGVDSFGITMAGSGVYEFLITPDQKVQFANSSNGNVFVLDSAGNLTISGTLSDASSRDIKENFIETDESILGQVMSLPIYFYNYTNEHDSIQHVGPTAEDFAAIFNVGADNKHISPRDLAGVAVAAVQELNKSLMQKEAVIESLQTELDEQQLFIEELEAKNAELEERLAILESVVLDMVEDASE